MTKFDVKFKPQDGGQLNDLAQALLDNHSDLIEHLDKFEIIEGAGALFGSDERPVTEVRMMIKLENTHEMSLEECEIAGTTFSAIMQLAEEMGAEITYIEKR